MAVVLHLYAQRMMDSSYQQQEIEGRGYNIVEQTFSAIPAVQAFGREELNDVRFKEATRDALAATLSLTNVQLQFKILIGLATAAGTAGILWLGTEHALRELSAGAILLFLSYPGSLYAPLESMMYSTSTIQGAAGSARRVWEVLQAEQEVRDKPGAPALSSVRGHVQIENVTFGHEPGRPILRNVSLEARPGETVAIVGSTGAGKSTLVSLVPRLSDPWAGRVVLDALDRLTQGRATFIIAHRLSTIRRANRIVALKDGQIAESGTHDELLARGGVYAGFFHTQFGRPTGATAQSA